uniref:Chitin-binding type-4 domain-containing protein n=1 Tax=Timema monikensis TaxID=170555 RepID=A0A7R9EEB6_9NEOP|nr:unnamed protein product [Timema monikensis]
MINTRHRTQVPLVNQLEDLDACFSVKVKDHKVNASLTTSQIGQTLLRLEKQQLGHWEEQIVYSLEKQQLGHWEEQIVYSLGKQQLGHWEEQIVYSLGKQQWDTGRSRSCTVWENNSLDTGMSRSCTVWRNNNWEPLLTSELSMRDFVRYLSSVGSVFVYRFTGSGRWRQDVLHRVLAWVNNHCLGPSGTGQCTCPLVEWIVEHALRQAGVEGHGRLMDPPSRNSMWRFGFPNPVNYNDNELFCGGYAVQWEQNQGRCGVCGDPFHLIDPRPHEAGGLYAKGIIGRHYTSGQEIDVEVELTANHWGRFEMYLCPNNNPREEATQSCFDRFPLYLSGSKDVGFQIPLETKKKAVFRYKVRLPAYVTCSQCVVQWTYFTGQAYSTGNMWGTCANGTEAVGCGRPETFRNCADITIVTSTSGLPPQFAGFQDNPFMLFYRDFRSNLVAPLVIRGSVHAHTVPTWTSRSAAILSRQPKVHLVEILIPSLPSYAVLQKTARNGSVVPRELFTISP